MINKNFKNLIKFNYEDQEVRTENLNGEAWVCLTDVCKILGIKNSRAIDQKGVEKIYTVTNGGPQELSFINEPNLYRLIFRSNKPQAAAFADWVYSEVLPSIRKTGFYGMNNIDMKALANEMEIREAKNFLTIYFSYGHTRGTEINGNSRLLISSDFFIPELWGMRTANILNSGRRPLTSVESPACSLSGGILKSMETTLKELISYTFKSAKVRTILLRDEVWFVASDIAEVLEYRSANDAVRLLDDDEADTHNLRIRSENGVEQNREVTIINESGLYSLILRSRKAEARAFKKFVTSEVLPSIRRTGGYGTGNIDVKALARAVAAELKATEVQRLPVLKPRVTYDYVEHVVSFVSDRVALDEGVTLCKDIYLAYLDWCKDHEVAMPISPNKLGRALGSLGYERCYLGAEKARRLTLAEKDLPDDISELLPNLEERINSGRFSYTFAEVEMYTGPGVYKTAAGRYLEVMPGASKNNIFYWEFDLSAGESKGGYSERMRLADLNAVITAKMTSKTERLKED